MNEGLLERMRQTDHALGGRTLFAEAGKAMTDMARQMQEQAAEIQRLDRIIEVAFSSLPESPDAAREVLVQAILTGDEYG